MLSRFFSILRYPSPPPAEPEAANANLLILGLRGRRHDAEGPPDQPASGMSPSCARHALASIPAGLGEHMPLGHHLARLENGGANQHAEKLFHFS
jgi:hypothetical protein